VDISELIVTTLRNSWLSGTCLSKVGHSNRNLAIENRKENLDFTVIASGEVQKATGET
jgi:hypothetical protein